MKPKLDHPVTNLSVSRAMIRKKELATALNVSSRTIDNWVRQRRIPVHRFSPRLLRYDLRRVQAALDKYEVIEAGRKLS
jgi:excisionase family DNA binding protein